MAELARRAGLSKQTISATELGEGNPTIETLEALALPLDISVRALLTEMGSEILIDTIDAAKWRTEAGMSVRHLDQAFGTGYVFNAVLRLDSQHGPSKHPASTRGALRHCYVLEGKVRVGPESAPVLLSTNDFVRFPADTPHLFDARSPMALLLVVTTAPQLSMSEGGTQF